MSQASDIFRNIADSLPQIVWALAPDGRIVWVNRRFIDVTGRDVASESAIDDGHLTEFIHPDDLALATDWLAAFERGESYGYEFRLKVRGGSYRWFRAHATPYRGADGEIEAWFGVSTDVDDIKSADASIRAILETIPQSLFVSDSRGVLLRVNSQMCAYTGKSAEQLLGTGWLDLVHPEDTADVRAARERGIAAETVTECTFRMRRHDGALRYQLARWAPMRDAAGSVTLWSSTMTDVHDQVREREELRLLADTIPQFICVTRADGRLDYANQQFWAYTGRPAENESFEWSDVVHPDDIAPARAFWAGCIADAQPRPELELRLRRADGTYRWFSSRVSPRRGEPGDPAAYYTTATDITERKRSADMLAFLAEASDVLTAARDVPKSLEIAASLAVPRIADWCAIYLRESNGLFAPAAIHHTDPAKVRLAAELVRRYPFSVETERQLIEKKAPVFVPEISLEMLDRSEEPARGAMLRRLDIASAIVVPLIVDDAVTGMLHLVRGRANARFARADVDFAEIFANRIAVAIDNAVMFERERNVAAAFQNAALPQTLPDVDGIALHRAYRTGDSAVSVGGDWYDAVRLRDGSLLFSIGDVAGKGLDAAVLMGSMRQAIRVAGLQGLAPGAVLDAANAALAAEGSSRFVTAFVGRIDAAGRLDYASAGHPAPFLRCGDSLCELRLGDPPLGVWDGTFATHATVLREPWLLVAFTDGLIERTGNVSEGLGRLRICWPTTGSRTPRIRPPTCRNGSCAEPSATTRRSSRSAPTAPAGGGSGPTTLCGRSPRAAGSRRGSPSARRATPAARSSSTAN